VISMKGLAFDFIRQIVRRLGIDVVRYRKGDAAPLPVDFDAAAAETIRTIRAYTMTSPERLYSLIQATQYVESARIPGDIVECGVWRGGSMMAVAKTLLAAGAIHRDLYLFDTFEGMTKPGERDISVANDRADEVMRNTVRSEDNLFWCYAPVERVRQALLSTGYPEPHLRFVVGKVEETLPGQAPSAIALLRLDTDWYESTKHELMHLFPRLSRGGVLIIDDYGHWKGARAAVDEYFSENGIKILLNRIDYTGRIALKAFD